MSSVENDAGTTLNACPAPHSRLQNTPADSVLVPVGRSTYVLRIATDVKARRPEIRRAVRAMLEQQLCRHWNCAADDFALHCASGTAPLLIGRGGKIFGLSFSHAVGQSVAAICSTGPVGIDLMPIEEMDDCVEVARQFLGLDCAKNLQALDGERRTHAFSRAWTSYEAQLKCLGMPLQEWSASVARQLQTTIATPLAAAPGMCASMAIERA